MINSTCITACVPETLHLTAWRTTALPTWKYQPLMAAFSVRRRGPQAHQSSRLAAHLQANAQFNPGLPLPVRNSCR
jgi:hypothetical protein